MNAPYGHPTAAELLAAVAEFLESEVAEATEGVVKFHARVAANVIRMVERELSSGLDPEAALRELGFATETELAKTIRDGALEDRGVDVATALRRLVADRLAVNNPGYSTAE